MDPFMTRMLERSKAQRSKLPESIANSALLREKQLIDAYFAGLQRGVAYRPKSGAENMQPVFQVSTTRVRSPTKLNDRLGKENKSPSTRKPKVSIVGPRSSELFQRRPPRSVYTSPLLRESGEDVYAKRYKLKSDKRSPRHSAKDDKEPLSVFKSKPNVLNDLGGEGKIQNTVPKPSQNLYPSLPKINTSFPYDLEVTSNCGSFQRGVADEKMDTEPSELRENPPKTPLNDVNVCAGGSVKKMVEKFSQSPVVTKLSHNSPVRISPKFEKFKTSPLASSTVHSPAKSPVRPKLVVPKLYHILEPSKPEFRDIQGDGPASTVDVDTRVVSAVSVQELPQFEKFKEVQPALSTYNVENFLRDALGSELCFQSISSISADTVYDGDSEVSVVSSESSPAVQTSNVNRNADRNGFLSLRHENHEKYCRPVLESSMPLRISGGLSLSRDDRAKRLTMEASIQRSLVAQTSKALYLCRSAKQFKDSRELVEGERILLLASLRCQAAQDEVKKCAFPTSTNPTSKGFLTISDIFVPLKWNVFPKLDRNLCSQWFLCVLIMDETVQATEVVQMVDNQPLLKFRGSMHLSDLSCDFRARLQLYTFRTPQLSPTRKNRIMQACKMLRRPARNCLGPAGSSEELMYIKSPAFTMIGCTELTVRLIGQEQPVSCSLEQVPMVSLIKGTINFRLSAQLTYTRQHSGFLNVLRPAGDGHAWQRWWCHLDGRVLRCWNYPSEQEEKDPVFSINLANCLSDKAVPAPRVLCSRSRTLMLESQRCRGPEDLNSTLLACSTDSTIVRHFLSVDSAAEMTEWFSAINESLEALRVWNVVPEMRLDKQI